MNVYPRIPNIWAVGRNYPEHAKEMGQAPAATGESPLIFLKPGSAVVQAGAAIRLPTWSNDVQHEVELAVRFGPGLRIAQYAVALDLTARDVQARLKAKGQPWTLAKAFTDSCPLGPLHALEDGDDLATFEFWLEVNGERRQTGRARDMIASVEAVAEFVRHRFPVQDGDLLLTGTPSGVGPLRPGDRVTAEIAGRSRAEWDCVSGPRLAETLAPEIR